MAKTYSPDDYVFTIGDLPITGFAPGTYVKVTRLKENGSIKVGAGGEAVIIISKDKSARATFTLLPTSSSNDDLSNLAARFEAQQPRGDGIVTFMGKDLNGTTNVHGDSAFVEKYPDFEGADDISNREWSILIPDMDTFIGGANA